jgi:hypothetical protein
VSLILVLVVIVVVSALKDDANHPFIMLTENCDPLHCSCCNTNSGGSSCTFSTPSSCCCYFQVAELESRMRFL